MDLVSQTSHLPGVLHGDYLSMSYVCLTSVHRDNFVHRGEEILSALSVFSFLFSSPPTMFQKSRPGADLRLIFNGCVSRSTLIPALSDVKLRL